MAPTNYSKQVLAQLSALFKSYCTHTHIFTYILHTYAHIPQLCTQWAHSMVTFGCLVTVTMDREQWSSTIVALDGLAFAQTAAGVLVMPQWPADSWDMRLGGQ